MQSPALPRVLPFAVYMLFVGVAELLSFTGLLVPSPETASLLYPVKILCAALALAWCLPRCPELRLRDLLENFKYTALAVFTGLLVFVLWINLDQPWATIGSPVPFNPDAAPSGAWKTALLLCRLAGASIIVPLLEELFWRSWLIRAIEGKDFLSIPVGRPNLFAFAATAVLFALEHNLVVAGLVAGVIYNLLLYRGKSVAQCVLAHAVTNLALGLWVMHTGNWQFW